MVYCTIDGKVAYPETGSKIKVTFENQFLNKAGEYTYALTFPMSILANYVAFGAANRIDTLRRINDFEEVRLYVENRHIISGKGTVTGITNEAVKLQIVGGASRLKYNSKLKEHYIDEMNIGETSVEYNWYHPENWLMPVPMTYVDNVTGFLGEEGKHAFMPIYDETNGYISNIVTKIFTDSVAEQARLAVQPNLMFVLKKVLEHEGYELVRNDLDKAPWNNLYIASARKSLRYKDALPHWSAYTFIDELRKLFNASLIIDEKSKTASLVAQSEIDGMGEVNYEALDEFSTEHDEDGLKSVYTSNISYDLEDSEKRNWLDTVSQQVLQDFPPVDYPDETAIVDAAQAMTQRERLTTLFHSLDDGLYFFWELQESDSGEKSEVRHRAGFFSPLIRDINSDDSVSLKITPVAIGQVERYENKKEAESGSTERYLWGWDSVKDGTMHIPSVPNEKESEVTGMTLDEEEEEYYVSVADAMNGTEVPVDEEDDDERMKIMFYSAYDWDPKEQRIVLHGQEAGNTDLNHTWYPLAATDYRRVGGTNFVDGLRSGSLSLHPTTVEKQIGSKFMNSQTVQKTERVTIKFVSDDIPDPSRIYVFRNRKYICEKIEVEITNGGVERVKTGYFFLID